MVAFGDMVPLGNAWRFHSPGDWGTWGRSSRERGALGTAWWLRSSWGHSVLGTACLGSPWDMDGVVARLPLGTQCPRDSRAPAPPAAHHEVDVGVLVSEILHQLLEAVLLPTDLGGSRGLRAKAGMQPGWAPSGVAGQEAPAGDAIPTPTGAAWHPASWDVALGTCAGMGTSSPTGGASPSESQDGHFQDGGCPGDVGLCHTQGN